MENRDITYVYIMGRAHSGTTVLDCLLDNIDGIQGCGEIAVGLPRLSETDDGNLPQGSFSFWDRVRSEYASDDNDLSWSEAVQRVHQQAHISKLLETWLTRHGSKYVDNTKRAIEHIADAIARTSGNDYIVDSSKELTRATFLARFFPNAKLIHLVRNPEHVAASTLHRIRNRHGFRFLRRNFKNNLLEPLFVTINCLGWLVGNAICEAISRAFPDKTITVKYEDITRNPRNQLSRIGDHIGKDMSSVYKSVEKENPISTGKKISGNALLEDESFVFDKNREPRDLPRIYNFVCRTICLPLMLRYEYL
jgi:hypothetical protein